MLCSLVNALVSVVMLLPTIDTTGSIYRYHLTIKPRHHPTIDLTSTVYILRSEVLTHERILTRTDTHDFDVGEHFLADRPFTNQDLDNIPVQLRPYMLMVLEDQPDRDESIPVLAADFLSILGNPGRDSLLNQLPFRSVVFRHLPHIQIEDIRLLTPLFRVNEVRVYRHDSDERIELRGSFYQDPIPRERLISADSLDEFNDSDEGYTSIDSDLSSDDSEDVFQPEEQEHQPGIRSSARIIFDLHGNVIDLRNNNQTIRMTPELPNNPYFYQCLPRLQSQ